MSNYEQLVKALRSASTVSTAWGRLMQDAAAAIESLQAVLKEADKKQEYQHGCICELTAENEEHKAEIEALQAEVEKYHDAFGRLSKTAVELEQRVVELRELPKRAKWIFAAGDGKTCCDGWECSSCGKTYHTNVPYFGEFKYCPNCGAKMEVQDGQ